MTNSNRLRNFIVAALIATSFPWVVADAQREKAVQYPLDYRSWQHVKSMLIQPGHALEDPFGGIHHVYANAEAMRGLSKNQYVDGAVFVFDLLDYDNSESLIVETERKRLDVMQYDSRLFAETGGWGFTTFVGNSKTERVTQDVVTACFACHVAAKKTTYVYSHYRP